MPLLSVGYTVGIEAEWLTVQHPPGDEEEMPVDPEAPCEVFGVEVVEDGEEEIGLSDARCEIAQPYLGNCCRWEPGGRLLHI